MKWAGGKSQLLERYRPHLPGEFGRYHEPFAGGAALFFELRRRRHLSRAVLSDTNRELVNLYTIVRDAVEELVGELGRGRYVHDERRYYEIRAWDVAKLSPVARAARLVYLNRTGFNGLYRLNRRGEFNVPFGRYVAPKICDPAALRAAAAAFAGVEIACRPFDEAAARAAPGDLVYFDPPYDPVGRTASFTAYQSSGFSAGDQARLAACFQALDDRGVLVLLSNSSTPFVRDLYAPYTQIPIPARRSINSVGARRGVVEELLVLGRTLERSLGRARGTRAAR